MILTWNLFTFVYVSLSVLALLCMNLKSKYCCFNVTAQDRYWTEAHFVCCISAYVVM